MSLLNTNADEYRKNVYIATEIFVEYGDFIYNIIRSKIKTKAEVDDLYQEFFLSLVAKPPHKVRNIKSYLYKAIINDINDKNRQIQRYKLLINKYAENFKFSINKTSSTNASNNEGTIERIFRLVRGCLSPGEAKTLTLKYNDNCSNAEIAKEIGLKKESVSRYISVGLKKIQQVLAEEGRES